MVKLCVISHHDDAIFRVLMWIMWLWFQMPESLVEVGFEVWVWVGGVSVGLGAGNPGFRCNSKFQRVVAKTQIDIPSALSDGRRPCSARD